MKLLIIIITKLLLYSFKYSFNFILSLLYLCPFIDYENNSQCVACSEHVGQKIRLKHSIRLKTILIPTTRRPLGVNSGYLGLCMYKYAAQRMHIPQLKANECSYVYIEVNANIL